MDSLTKKTLQVSRALTYTYYTFPAAHDKPTLLLLHGFPDSAAEWSDLITSHLVPAGYGVIAPDCLGYGGTSKPTDPHAYAFTSMVPDIIEILDAENVPRVISLGHDWGCALAQRVYNIAPDRVSGLVMVNVTYVPPSNDPFDLDATLALTEKVFGYGTFWYWKFFLADDAPGIVHNNLDSFFDAMHSPGEKWKELLCTPDGLRNFVARGERCEVQPYATEELRSEWTGRLRRGGLTAPFCWYKAMNTGLQRGEEGLSSVVKCPSFYVGFTQDFVCRHEMIGQSEKAGLLPDLTKVLLEGSHWGLMDKTKEFGEAIVGWLEKSSF